MLRQSTAIGTLLFATASAQTAEEQAAYPEYAQAFAKHNTTWETIKVKLSDGFTLTMFHITGSTETGPYTPTKPAILFQHGMGGSAFSWLAEAVRSEKTSPIVYQMAELGFDCYLANNSGVKYSQEHDFYSVYQKEYWEMDWRKFGVIDFPAQVAEIQKRNGGAKVATLGHSQGTTQTWAGMAKMPEWYDANVSVAAFMGSCTSPTTNWFEGLYTPEVYGWLVDNEVYVLAGPDWPEVKAKIEYDGPQVLIDKMWLYEGLANNSVQAIAAYAQAAFSQRFQEYTADWWDYYAEHGKYPKTNLMDYGIVQEMQVAFYAGLFDNTCPLPQVQKQFESLGAQAVHWVVAPWQGHGTWADADSDWFRDDLAEVLQRNQ